MNLPNKITLTRIFLIPIFVLLFYFLDSPHKKIILAIFFAIMAISDFVDGYVARKTKQTTELGALLDPIADKVMTISVIVLYIGNGIPAFLFTAAQTVVSSALAGILNSLTPFFTMLLGYFFFRTTFSAGRVAGVVIGLAGAVYLITMNSGGKFSADVPHILLIVFATICYATSVNVIRHRLAEINSKHIAGFAMCFAGPPAAVYLFSTDFLQRLFSGTPALLSFMYICILAVFGTSVSIVIFNYLIKISGALFAASCTYLIPVVAIMWGYADRETLDISLFIGMALILFGVWLISRKK